MLDKTLQDIIREIADKAILAQRAIQNQNFAPAERNLDDIIELTDEAEGAIPELNFD